VIVIWHRKDCHACLANAPLFDRLATMATGDRQASVKSAGSYRVVRVQATAERLANHHWIKVLPTFDVIRMVPHADAIAGLYGPGTHTVSIPNTRQDALAEFVGATVVNGR
jgi:hypothetical protein